MQMKKSKGVTLVSLVLTVIIMIIISSVSIQVSLRVYDNVKIENYVAKLKVIQSKVDNLVEESNDINSYNFTQLESIRTTNSDDYDIFYDIITKPEEHNILDVWNSTLDSDIENYYYFDKKGLEKLGLKDQDITVAINFKTRNVIEKNGLKIDGEAYYRQYDLRLLSGGEQIYISDGEVADAPDEPDSSLTYKITYDANGGTGAPVENRTFKTGVEVNLSSQKPTRSGYTFAGWSTKQNGTKSDVITKYRIQNTNVTIFAVWEKNYKITYDANGGTNAPIDNNQYREGQIVTLSLHQPIKSGYTFVGWSTKPDGTRSDIIKSYQIQNTNVTIYAVWEISTDTE